MNEILNVIPSDKLPLDEGWLTAQKNIVIAVGKRVANADVVVSDQSELPSLLASIKARPLAALTLVQVLRAVEKQDMQTALTLESLAYACLQGGSEHRAWLSQSSQTPKLLEGEGQPILFERRDDMLFAQMARPQFRNAISVEMRDAWLLALEMLAADPTITTLQISGAGACFSVGGALEEFGLCSDPSQAHWIRSVHSPARQMSIHGTRVRCYVHGACIGSGIELPAFAHSVVASPTAFFQLPELRMGLIPGAGGCVSISRRIGRQRMADWVLRGKRVRAPQALSWGLIDAIEDRPVDRE